MKALGRKNRMYYIFVITSVVLLINNNSIAQPHLWANFDPFYNRGTELIIEGNDIWIGKSEGGVVRFDKQTKESEYYKRFYTPLTTNSIIRVINDNLGNKWFGMYSNGNTEKPGIAKFDGTSWEIFNSGNSLLPDNNVWNFDVDTYGNLWVSSTVDGLLKFDGQNWIRYDTTNSSLPSNSVRAIAADTSGNVWFFARKSLTATYLIRFDGIEMQIFDPDSTSLPAAYFYKIIIDKNNIKWMYCLQGIVKFDDVTFNIYNPALVGLNIHVPRAMVSDNHDNLYIGAGQNGLIKLDSDGGWTQYQIGDTTYDNNVNGIAIDEDGTIWLTTYFGLTKFDSTVVESFDLSNARYVDSRTGDIMIEENGTIWFGGWGIVKYDGVNWKRWDYTNSILPNAAVTKIDKDKNNNIWVGTYEGLVKIIDTTIQLYTIDNSELPSNWITDIAVEESNVIWITTENGIVRMENDSIKVYDSTNSPIVGAKINAVEIDRSNNKWFGGESCGLLKYDDLTWTVYNSSNSGLNHNLIEDMCIAVDGNIWLAMRLIQKFNGTSFFTYYPYDYLQIPNYAIEIEADSAGNIWTSSFQAGIIKIDRWNNWSLYNNQNSGLIGVNQMVHSTRIDKNGYKYFATNDGGVSVYKGDLVMSVDEEDENQIPRQYSLMQNYPNPFNPTTLISYHLPNAGNVKLSVYNLLGQEVQRLVNSFMPSGAHTVNFDATRLPSGVYLYKIEVNDFVQARKMMLIK